jgi:hypothetical protein
LELRVLSLGDPCVAQKDLNLGCDKYCLDKWGIIMVISRCISTLYSCFFKV